MDIKRFIYKIKELLKRIKTYLEVSKIQNRNLIFEEIKSDLIVIKKWDKKEQRRKLLLNIIYEIEVLRRGEREDKGMVLIKNPCPYELRVIKASHLKINEKLYELNKIHKIKNDLGIRI